MISCQVIHLSVFASVNRKWAPPILWLFWLHSRHKSTLWGIAKEGSYVSLDISGNPLVLVNVQAISCQVICQSVFASVNRKWTPLPCDHVDSTRDPSLQREGQPRKGAIEKLGISLYLGYKLTYKRYVLKFSICACISKSKVGTPPLWSFWLHSRHNSSPWGTAKEVNYLKLCISGYPIVLANVLAKSCQVIS